MQDNDIIDLFLSRDEDAITQTSVKYGASLRHIAFGILGDRETAKECENDTYYEAWRRIPPHEPRDYLFAFLGKITRAIAINRLRKKLQQKNGSTTCEFTAELQECIPAPGYAEEPIEADELRRLIEAFLDSCTQKQQNIFVRRYWYCDSIKQISESFKIPANTVKSILFRLREKLKLVLEEGGYHL